MTERSLRSDIVRALRALDACAVENPAGPGTPDINYIGGWIELKVLDEWPIKEDTFLQIDHFTPQQRIWLDRRWRKGGAAFVLLKVAQDWLLLEAPLAVSLLGRAKRSDLLAAARRHWTRWEQVEDELPRCLKR